MMSSEKIQTPTEPKLFIEEGEDKTRILPTLHVPYFTVLHNLKGYNDYYKTKQAIIYKTYAEISYVNDEGLTAEIGHRKIVFSSYEIVNDELVLYDARTGEF